MSIRYILPRNGLTKSACTPVQGLRGHFHGCREVSGGSLVDTWQLTRLLTYCSTYLRIHIRPPNKLYGQRLYSGNTNVCVMKYVILRLYAGLVQEPPLYYPIEGHHFEPSVHVPYTKTTWKLADLSYNDKGQPEQTKCLTLARTGLRDVKVCTFVAVSGTVDSCSSEAITLGTIDTSAG